MANHISLDPENPPGVEAEPPLSELIQRVTQERGSFANLNEKELEERSAAAAAAAADGTETNTNTNEETEAVGDSAASKIEENEEDFKKLRAELAAKVATALNESALNLDFVSLLVSASRPQAGESSMSPMLKSQIPSGSFNADTVINPAPAIGPRSGYGWKIGAFERSAEHLQSSCSDLRRRVKLEAQFWRDMLYISTENGEVVNRKMVIKYGYMDAGSDFTGAGYGYGTLHKRETDGHAVFEPKNKVNPELVQVSVFTDTDTLTNTASGEQSPKDRLLGRSVIPFDFALKDLQEPLKSIRYERNWLFEHELMQRIIKEARTSLASNNVTLQNGRRVVCTAFGLRIEIELVDPSSVDQQQERFDYAGVINYSLHLLLVDSYKQNFKNSHSKPPALSSNSKPPPPQPILGSVLAHIQHSILVSRAIRLVQVMLPDAEVKTESETSKGLKDAPISVVKIYKNGREMQLEIRSPITMGEHPPILGKMDGFKPTKVFDLTELEVWLKWISK